jgi:hypothetical protein
MVKSLRAVQIHQVRRFEQRASPSSPPPSSPPFAAARR